MPSNPASSDAPTPRLSAGDQFNFAPAASGAMPPSDFPSEATQFWMGMYAKLNTSEQADLFRLFKSMRTGPQIPESDRQRYQDLVNSIQLPREQFHQSLFDDLTLTSDRSPEKNKRSNDLYESQEMWDKKIHPAMTAAAMGEEITMSQHLAVHRLQVVLDELALNQVNDQQAIGWAGDAEAWKRLWEESELKTALDPEPTTRIQLMGQPGFYRGKWVTVEGWVRSARKKMLDANSELGMSHYYVLWVRPKESKLGPFCIYTATLPDGFPEVTETFSDMNENIRTSGFFFKIRTYIATDRSVQNCPVLIAPGITSVMAPVPFTVKRWQPSWVTLVVSITLIPVLALAVVWFAIKSSKTPKTRHNQKRENQIDQSLQQLADDPRVETDREKIDSLYEREFDHE